MLAVTRESAENWVVVGAPDAPVFALAEMLVKSWEVAGVIEVVVAQEISGPP